MPTCECEYCGDEAAETYQLRLSWPAADPEDYPEEPVEFEDPGAAVLDVCGCCADGVASNVFADRLDILVEEYDERRDETQRLRDRVEELEVTVEDLREKNREFEEFNTRVSVSGSKQLVSARGVVVAIAARGPAGRIL